MQKRYYCNSCTNYTSTALLRGSGAIEVLLYLCWLIPGFIYSAWRRNGPANKCPLCKVEGLVPASAAPRPNEQIESSRDEVECPFCAERILAKARVCKHCKKEVRIPAPAHG